MLNRHDIDQERNAIVLFFAEHKGRLTAKDYKYFCVICGEPIKDKEVLRNHHRGKCKPPHYDGSIYEQVEENIWSPKGCHDMLEC